MAKIDGGRATSMTAIDRTKWWQYSAAYRQSLASAIGTECSCGGARPAGTARPGAGSWLARVGRGDPGGTRAPWHHDKFRREPARAAQYDTEEMAVRRSPASDVPPCVIRRIDRHQ